MPRRQGTASNASASEVHSPRTAEGNSEPPTDTERGGEQEGDQSETQSSDGNEDHGEEQDTPVVNPSKDIKGDLKRLLEKETFKLNGSFYHSKSHAHAPNPGLRLDELGIVGLPLSEDAAQRLISKCKPAPFGKGERTIVDRNVRDTWEMDASKVSFESPAWKKWITKTIIPMVCESLGVNMATAMPRAELYKLLVYETGSHFLSHQDTEKVAGMFATFVIILPSKFTGGSLKLLHARESTIVDAAPHSLFATHVAAWYTDVYHSVSPVQSGYRLALSYNLIHTNAPSLKPTLAGMSVEAQELRHVMLSWKQAYDPEKIIYLLDHMYSEYNLRASTLKGKDAARVAHLRAVAEELRFRVCLVTAELHQSGQAEDDGYYGPDYSLEDVEESEFKITDAFDLNGNEIELHEDLEMDDDDCIPYPLSKTDPDEEEYEGYQGNYGGNMDLWYRRTALLIWPAKWDAEVVVWNYPEYAKEHLEGLESKKPTRNEREVIDELREWMEENVGEDGVDDVAEIVTRAAVHWKDPDMWMDALRAAHLDCSFGESLNASTITNDVGILGFQEVEDFLTGFMENCESDEDRSDLIAALEEIAEEKKINDLKLWIQEHRATAPLPKRRKQVGHGTIQELLALAREQGGTYLQDVIIPQLKGAKARRRFLFTFAEALRTSTDLTSISPAVLNSSITDILMLAIHQARLFPVLKPKGQDNKAKADFDDWILTFQLAQKADRQLVNTFCQRMEDTLENSSVEKQNWLAGVFLPGATSRLDSWARLNAPPMLPGDTLLLPFWKATVQVYMKRISNYQEPLVLALHWKGDLDGMKNELAPLLVGYCSSNIMAVQKLARCAELLHRKVTNEVEITSASSILDTICETLAVHCPLDVEGLISTAHTLLACNATESVQTLLNRLTQHASGQKESENLVLDCLLPFMRSAIVSLQQLKLLWPSEPVSAFAAFAISRAVELLGPKVLSSTPPSSLELGCNCAHCKDVETFALDGRTELSITAAQFTRTHVEKQLNSKGAGWGFSATTVKGRTPYTLLIIKPPRTDPTAWKAKRDHVLAALNDLGSLSVQKEVMDMKWPEICKALDIDPSSAETTPTAFHTVAKVVQNASEPQPLPAGIPSQPTRAAASKVTDPVASTSTSQTPKRPYDQVVDAPTAGTSAQGAKRSKPSQRPIEIIELSDSD